MAAPSTPLPLADAFALNTFAGGTLLLDRLNNERREMPALRQVQLSRTLAHSHTLQLRSSCLIVVVVRRCRRQLPPLLRLCSSLPSWRRSAGAQVPSMPSRPLQRRCIGPVRMPSSTTA
jgi:hypothetical protein